MILPLLALCSFDALVVTNNASGELNRPDLRYADDDGVHYARLFRDAFGEKNVMLLTELDRDSAGLYGAVADAPPARNALFSAVQRLASRVSAQGEVYLVFAGHGDVRNGKGFFTLSDGVLTSDELEERVLAPLKHARVHLIIDSCNSYFMIMPRKPGGTPFKLEPTKPVPHPTLGVLLSTSAEALTYEWSEIQSGIFSYVVRSALRGAADADGDGAISYTEMATFVDVATRGIANEAYRPRVFIRQPQTAAPIFVLPSASPGELFVAAGRGRRLTVRDSRGVRLLDLHSDGKSALRVWLPGEALTVEERDGKHIVQRDIGANEHRDLDTLPAHEPIVAGRGESPILRNLFSTPFGRSDVEEATSQPVKTEVYGVSLIEVERSATALRALANRARQHRFDNAWSFGTMSAGLFGVGLPLALSGNTQSTAIIGIGLAAAGGALAALSLPLTLAKKSRSERLFAEFSQLKLDSEADRAAAIAMVRAQIDEAAREERRSKLVAGVASTTAAALWGTAAGLLFSLRPPPQTTPAQPFTANVLGALCVGVGGAMLVQGLRAFLTLPPELDHVSIVADDKGVFGSMGMRF